ncbi:unnamed protein product [[Candida] boidinii]|nr:unnamed protein product [[Candida] boidinii]
MDEDNDTENDITILQNGELIDTSMHTATPNDSYMFVDLGEPGPMVEVTDSVNNLKQKGNSAFLPNDISEKFQLANSIENIENSTDANNNSGVNHFNSASSGKQNELPKGDESQEDIDLSSSSILQLRSLNNNKKRSSYVSTISTTSSNNKLKLGASSLLHNNGQISASNTPSSTYSSTFRSSSQSTTNSITSASSFVPSISNTSISTSSSPSNYISSNNSNGTNNNTKYLGSKLKSKNNNTTNNKTKLFSWINKSRNHSPSASSATSGATASTTNTTFTATANHNSD